MAGERYTEEFRMYWGGFLLGGGNDTAAIDLMEVPDEK